MMLTAADFRDMTAAIVRVADEVCGGRVVAAHEGGYSEPCVPFAGVACVEALAGVELGDLGSLRR
jgi:acetoin utilization deacetylase AcuC-like enzyme